MKIENAIPLKTARRALHRSAIVIAAALILGALPAGARNPDGTLGALLLPNEGRPITAVPGASAPVRATAPGPITLVGPEGLIPVSVTWTGEAPGFADGVIQLPLSLRPGWYDVQIDGPEGVDRTPHAVCILPAFEPYYVFGLVSRPVTPGTASAVLGGIAASEAQVAFLSGVQVADGNPQELGELLDALRQCATPVHVGASDPGASARFVEQYFGPAAFGIAHAGDTYLMLPPGNGPAEDGSAASGLLHESRRAHRGQRWATAFVPSPALALGMRERLILLLDDPVDFLICTPLAAPLRPTPPRVRLGRTTLFEVPASELPDLLLVDVTPARGLLPRLPAPSE